MTNVKNIIKSLVLAGVLICAPAFVYDAQAATGDTTVLSKQTDVMTAKENVDTLELKKKMELDNNATRYEDCVELAEDTSCEGDTSCMAEKAAEKARCKNEKTQKDEAIKNSYEKQIADAKKKVAEAEKALETAKSQQKESTYKDNLKQIEECKKNPDAEGCKDIEKTKQFVSLYEQNNPKSEAVKAQEKARKEEQKQAQKDAKKAEDTYNDKLKLIEKCKSNSQASGCDKVEQAKKDVENYEAQNPNSDAVKKQAEKITKEAQKQEEKERKKYESAKKDLAKAQEQIEKFCSGDESKRDTRKCEAAQKEMAEALAITQPYEQQQSLEQAQARMDAQLDADIAALDAELDADIAALDAELDAENDEMQNVAESIANTARKQMEKAKKEEADAKKRYEETAEKLQQAQMACDNGDDNACGQVDELRLELGQLREEYQLAYQLAREAEKTCRDAGCEQEQINVNPYAGLDYRGFGVDNPDEMYNTGSNDVFKTVTRRAAFILYHLKPLIYMLAGFGLIGFAFAAIFNKISWKWFGNLAIGLFLVANTGRLVEYMVFPSKGGAEYMKLQQVGELKAFGDNITVSKALGDTEYAWVDNTYFVPSYSPSVEAPKSENIPEEEVKDTDSENSISSDTQKDTRGFCKAETKGGGLFGGGAFTSCVKDIIAAGKKAVDTVKRTQATVDAVRNTVNTVVNAAQNIGDAAKVMGENLKAGDVAGAFQALGAIGGNVKNAVVSSGSMLNFANENMSAISNNLQDMTKSRDQVAELNLQRISGEATNKFDAALQNSGYVEGVRNVTDKAANAVNTFVDGATTGADLAGGIQNFGVPNKVIDGKLYGKTPTINDAINKNRNSGGGTTLSSQIVQVKESLLDVKETVTPPVTLAESYQTAQKATYSAQNAYNSAEGNLSRARDDANNKALEAERLREIADKTGLAADKAKAEEAEFLADEAAKELKKAQEKYDTATTELETAKKAEQEAQVANAKDVFDEADRNLKALEQAYELASDEEKAALEEKLTAAQKKFFSAQTAYLTLTESAEDKQAREDINQAEEDAKIKEQSKQNRDKYISDEADKIREQYKPVEVDPVQAAKQAAYNLSQAKSTAKTAEDKASRLEKDAKDKAEEAAELRKKANESGDPIDEIAAQRAETEATRAKEDAEDARAKADEAATKEQEAQTAADEAYAKGATYARETAEKDKADAEANIEKYEEEIETLQGNLSTLEENYKKLAAVAEESKADADVVAAGTAYKAYQNAKTKIGELQTQIGKEKERKRKAEDAYYDAAEAEITYSK